MYTRLILCLVSTCLAFIGTVYGSDSIPSSSSAQQNSLVVLVDENNFDAVVGKGFTSLTITAAWCKDCRKFAPVLEETALELEGLVTIAKVEWNISRQFADSFEPNGYPTTIFYRDGVEVGRCFDYIPKDTFISLIYASLEDSK